MTNETDSEAIRRFFEGSGYSEAECNVLETDIDKLKHTLKVSDDLMHNVILHARYPKKQYELPDDPEAKVQYGLILYWIKNPPGWLNDMFEDFVKRLKNKKLRDALKFIWKHLKKYAKKHVHPKVTEPEYNYLKKQIDCGQGIVAPEGEILGKSKYQQLDTNWLYAFFGYLLNLVPGVEPAPFGTEPYKGTMQAGRNGTVRIAVIGDWGTGSYEEGIAYDPASQVMTDLCALNPDYIIHLGDVYYAGTQDRPLPGEESKKLVEMWPEMPPERSFTLNSNHEMYGGGDGYFNVALGKDTPFSHQNRTSYFSLRFGSWALVGLDAAYHDPSALYMKGSLGDRNEHPHQYEFLKTATKGAKRVIVFTHQTGMDVTGRKALPLRDEVCGVLKLKPVYWYWGHIHLGVVYTKNSVVGRERIAARCIGHSAVPFGDPYLLKKDGRMIETVEWYANTPVDPADVGEANAKDKLRIAKNGFALLTLSNDSITEEIYETGNKNPVWSARA